MHVVFVCLGNICRSPMAEAIFTRMVEDAGLSDTISVDSCGTNAYHAGTSAHPGAIRILEAHGISYDGVSRLVEKNDMDADYVVCMDSENQRALEERFAKQAILLLDFTDSEETDVPDPYYTSTFDEVYALIEDGCRGLLESIREDHGL